jgi:hypothetical protein
MRPNSGALCTALVIAEFTDRSEKWVQRRIKDGRLPAERHYDPVVGGRGFYWTMPQTAATCNSGSWADACAAWGHPLVTICGS